MIKLFSKMTFIVMGAFHFLINYIVFMINYAIGHTTWIVNNNSIGEATIEAIAMTLLFPFFIYGLYLYVMQLDKALKSC